MPKADGFLTGALPQTHNPTQRIKFFLPDIAFDPLAVLQQWITWLETYGLDALQQVTGVDFTLLKPILDNLKTFLGGIDLTSGTFDPAAAAEQFIENVLLPTNILTGHADFQTIVDGLFHLGEGGAGTGNTPLAAVESLLGLNDVAVGDTAALYPPYAIPYTPAAPPSQLAQYLGLLTRVTSFGDFTVPGFDFNTGLQNMIKTLLTQNLLAGLTNGQISTDVLPTDLLNMLKQIITLGLPAATIPTSPADIITLAISAWNSWWSIITGTQQQATAAATQAASNTAAINQQITGGTSIVDTEFNTVATSNINSSYTTLYQGSGGGGLFADGIGNIVWMPSGGIARTGFFLPPGTLSTDNFDVQLLLDPDTAIPPPFNGSQCYIWILARSNSAATEFTACRIGYNNVLFGDAHVSGSGLFIARSVSFPIVSGPGDSFVLRGGYTASAWELKLLQNSKTVADYTDTGHNATIGSGFRCVGGGMTAADQDGGRSQLVPPKITSITASDRLASAA